MKHFRVFISADMGAGITDAVERLYHIHDLMNGSKNSPIAQVQYSVQESILPKLPLSIGRQTVFDSLVAIN